MIYTPSLDAYLCWELGNKINRYRLLSEGRGWARGPVEVYVSEAGPLWRAA